MKVRMSLFTAAFFVRASAFTSRTSTGRNLCVSGVQLMMSTSSSSSFSVENHVSRLETLQKLLSEHGAPGSRGCASPNDLKPVTADSMDDEALLDLHPHLYPIAVSSKTGNYICALRRAYADDAEYQSSNNAPWPIVESKVQGVGYSLLALNSEHFMRRMVAEADAADSNPNIIDIYNQGLGQGNLKDQALDLLYEAGSVEKLGYGAEKYVLLRVGPFPDLYQQMSQQHVDRKDESSALIAAEAANGKFVGFASTFASYANLLSSLPNRKDETRDAARMCLRLPIPSIGMNVEDFITVAKQCQPSNASDDDDDTTVLKHMKEMFEAIRKHEADDDETRANMTPEQIAIDEVNYILDTVALSETEPKWSKIRKQIADIYASASMDNMADFVDPSRAN